MKKFSICLIIILVAYVTISFTTHYKNKLALATYAECQHKYAGANFITCAYPGEKQDDPVMEITTTETVIKISAQPTTIKNSVVTDEPPVMEILRKYFGKEAELAHAIALAESRGNPKTTGYNCYYTRKDGVLIAHTTRVKGAVSKACKIEHRKYAWSRDIGYMQVNDVHGGDELYNLEQNIKQAKEVRDKQGWTAWSTYNAGKHLAYLK
jgi:hypothetical protein